MLDELREYRFVAVDDQELAALSPEDLDTQLWNGIAFRYTREQ